MKFYGYVSPKPFAGMSMPAPAQSTCLREFASNRGALFVLPYLESHFDNCYHQLFGLVADADTKSTIAMYSVTMLPNREKRTLFFNECQKKAISLGFVLEALLDEYPFKQTVEEIQNYELESLSLHVDEFLRLEE